MKFLILYYLNPSGGNNNTVQKRVFARTILGLSVTQIILGDICIIMGIVALTSGYDEDNARMHGNGIWTGAFVSEVLKKYLEIKSDRPICRIG